MNRPTRSGYHAALWLCSLLLACFSPGCAARECPATPDAGLEAYGRCLERHETVTAATQAGPFTTLDISYSAGSGYFTSTHNTYKRILYKGRVVAPKVEAAQTWSGPPGSVLFADWWEHDDKGKLHLMYERAGQPVVERIEQGGSGWDASYEYPYGYPLQAGTRYFPRYLGGFDSGFLLSVLPTRLTRLPLGPQGVNVPWTQSLAGIAPDGKAYAYSNSRTAPSGIVIVDADGTLRDPVPIPVTTLPANMGPGANPFEPVWRWFSASFAWQKDAQGRWQIVPAWAGSAAATANPVEELFIDAEAGYRNCFAGAVAHCLKGWRPIPDVATRLDDCCLSRYAYEPIAPWQAFGADVVAVVYSKGLSGNSGYQLLLDAPPERVVEAIGKRLNSRGASFVRSDKCANFASRENDCRAQLIRNNHWDDPESADRLVGISAVAAQALVFVTPTAAFAFYPESNGRTRVVTLARYEGHAW